MFLSHHASGPNLPILTVMDGRQRRRTAPSQLHRLRRPPIHHWSLADGRDVSVPSHLKTNDGELAHQWALDGAGLVMKSIRDVGGDIRAGRLERVLSDFKSPAAPIHAVYPHAKHAAAKVRLCVAFLLERMEQNTPPTA
jgi:DNA-binding transcriptional LysR family regulator